MSWTIKWVLFFWLKILMKILDEGLSPFFVSSCIYFLEIHSWYWSRKDKYMVSRAHMFSFSIILYYVSFRILNVKLFWFLMNGIFLGCFEEKVALSQAVWCPSIRLSWFPRAFFLIRKLKVTYNKQVFTLGKNDI